MMIEITYPSKRTVTVDHAEFDHPVAPLLQTRGVTSLVIRTDRGDFEYRIAEGEDS